MDHQSLLLKIQAQLVKLRTEEFRSFWENKNYMRIRNLFQPLTQMNRKALTGLFLFQAVVVLLIWEFTKHDGLIPTPSKIFKGTMAVLSTEGFYENLFSSLALTFKGMGISIVIALVISYLSLIPFFYPFAKFVIKCRYLTLTGLVFLFTLLTSNGSDLKLSLLIFGIVPFFVTSFLSVIDAINIQEYELCKTLRMSNWETLKEVVIVGKIDQALDVMRQNFAIAWIMITSVEGLSMSEGGLGTMLIKSNKYIDLSTVFGILVIIFLLGMIFDYLLAAIRAWLFPYTRLQIRK
jgi:ABC-type nitrate/sulfonate/bicarbonate transport system permease component